MSKPGIPAVTLLSLVLIALLYNNIGVSGSAIYRPDQIKEIDSHLQQKGKLGPQFREKLLVRSKRSFKGKTGCATQTVPCVSTFNDNCCRGNKCTDVYGGFCMGKPFQTCFCVPEFYGHN